MQDIVYAGFMRRFAAVCLDQVILGFMLATMGFVLIFPALLLGFFSMVSMVTITLFTVGLWLGGFTLLFGSHWLYHAGFEASTLQATPGKLALGLRVCDKQFQRISLQRSTIRYFSSFLSGLLLHLGYLIALFTERKQTLHDLISETYVLRVVSRPATIQVVPAVPKQVQDESMIHASV